MNQSHFKSIENSADRVLNYIKSLPEDSSPSLYSGRADKLVALSDKLHLAVDTLDKFLCDRGLKSLQTSDVPRSDCLSPETAARMDAEIQELKHQMSSVLDALGTAQEKSRVSEEIVSTSDLPTFDDVKYTSKRKLNLTIPECVSIKNRYQNALLDSAHIRYENDIAREFAAFAWDYFKARFVDCGSKGKIIYDVTAMGGFIEQLFLGFVYYREKGMIMTFKTKISEFMSDIQKDNTYPLPPIIHDFSVSLIDGEMLEAAAAAWFELVSTGYERLLSINNLGKTSVAYLHQDISDVVLGLSNVNEEVQAG